MKKSHTLTIETVSNGWIVRPFDIGDWSHGCAVRGEIQVFSNLHDLQIALPGLLARPSDQ